VAVIETAGLTKTYPRVTALDGLDVRIGEGVTGLVGANGAGKSTLIKILLGLVPATSGGATVLGHDVATEGARIRALVGYMPEHDCLPADVSASDLVVHLGQMSGLPYPAARERASDVLRHVGLAEERYRPIGGYSTGMKQRVKLGQALVHDPAFVFLDEPTAGLDPIGREEMLALVRKTHREFGISVLLSSHLMADVERTCDRIVVLQGGSLVQSGEVGHFTRELETIHLEVDTNREALVVALERRGVRVVPDGGGFTIAGSSETLYDQVRDALVEAEAPLRRLAPSRRALTELFEAKP
jgi:ABC-2 type transport system ATP-binding protein